MKLHNLNQDQEFIEALDLQSVMNQLVVIEKWSEDEAKAAIQQYRRWLFLRKKYSDQILPPSQDIDQVWHAHILQTREYRQFCQQVFIDTPEQFLDHNPADEHNADQFCRLFQQTQNLYQQEFGEYIYQIRGRSFIRKILEKIGEKLIARFPNLGSNDKCLQQ